MSNHVSSENLLKGAIYALEQCGLLLRDANVLYQSRSHASALALAAFAREELGRWSILLDLRRKVINGEQVTLDEVKEQCVVHVRKQAAGMMSLTLRTQQDTGLGKLLNVRMKSAPDSDEFKVAEEQLKKLDRQRKNRIPDDRHKQRMSALYVDIASADGWTRPSKEISREAARDFLNDAVNDYSSQRNSRCVFDSELQEALAQWLNRPELPVCEWPSYT